MYQKPMNSAPKSLVLAPISSLYPVSALFWTVLAPIESVCVFPALFGGFLAPEGTAASHNAARRLHFGHCGELLGLSSCPTVAGNAEGVRHICGRCVFKCDTFHSQSVLGGILLGFECGRCAPQNHTFRKTKGDLPQKTTRSASFETILPPGVANLRFFFVN